MAVVSSTALNHSLKFRVQGVGFKVRITLLTKAP